MGDAWNIQTLRETQAFVRREPNVPDIDNSLLLPESCHAITGTRLT